MDNRTIIRSPFFYVGDKYKLLREILGYFPKEINNYVEPFAGGGSVFLNIDAKKYYLNDINHNVIGLHATLIKHSNRINSFFDKVERIINRHSLSYSHKADVVPDELKKKWKKTYYAEYNRKGYNALRDRYNESNTKNYVELYILLIYGFNRIIRFNSSKKFNVPVGNVDFNVNVKSALLNYFNKVRNKDIVLTTLDFEELFNRVKLSKNDFVYFDPPYLITASEYNKLWSGSNELQLIKLLDHLNERGVKFAISNVVEYKGKKNKVFIEWAKAYNVYPIKSNYISYHDNSVKRFKEVLVTNYEHEKAR